MPLYRRKPETCEVVVITRGMVGGTEQWPRGVRDFISFLGIVDCLGNLVPLAVGDGVRYREDGQAVRVRVRAAILAANWELVEGQP